MKPRTEWLLAGGPALVVALIVLASTGMAQRLAPSGMVFPGFLVNPVDGFSYLAKMRQGADGSWTFGLPYVGIQGGRAAIFLFYLALGHLASWLGASLLGVFLAARFVTTLVMFLTCYALLRILLPSGQERWWAYALILVGSGLGWAALPFGLLATDMLVAESIPFYSALANPHFPLAYGLMAGAVWLVLSNWSLRLRLPASLLLGTLLGIVLPFAVLSLMAVLGVWLVLELVLRSKAGSTSGALAPAITSACAGAAGAAPWILYDYWITRTDPALAAWSMQNQTPSPPVGSFAVGFGLVLLLALLGAYVGRLWTYRQGRLLLTWAVTNAVLLYLPFALQRRLSLGMFLPLAVMAALGLVWLSKRPPRWRWAPVVLLVLAIPSNGLVMTAGLVSVARGDPFLLEKTGELNAYRWVASHVAPDSSILSAPLTGVRLPAFADVRVMVGHPFETPGYQQRVDLVDRWFDGQGGAAKPSAELAKWNLDYVFYGPGERALGPRPAWLDSLPVVYDHDDVQIFAIGPP